MNDPIEVQKPEPLLAKNVNQGQHVSYLPVEEKRGVNLMALVPAGTVVILGIAVVMAVILAGA